MLVLSCLGHQICASASSEFCVRRTRSLMWAAFMRSFTPALRSLRLKAKLRFLSQHVLSIARARWSRWSFCKTAVKTVDGTQTRMVALLIGATPLPLEDYHAFCARRLRQAGTVCSKYARFSHFWAKDTVKWYHHVSREHDLGSWCSDLLKYRQLSFIDQLRSTFS